MLVESGLKPLESIFKKPVLSTLPKLQKFVLVFDKYDSQHVQVVYKSGKTMFLADHLSRSYLNETKEALVPKLQVSKIHLTSFLRRKYRTRYGRTPVKMTSYNHSWGHSLGWMAKQQSRPNTRK